MSAERYTTATLMQQGTFSRQDIAASQEESHATENGNPRPSGRGGCQKRPQSSTVVHALLDRLEAVEKEYQHVLAIKETYQRQLNETEDERDELRATQHLALEVLENVRGNINPERGYADELEVDVERAIATITTQSAKGKEK